MRVVTIGALDQALFHAMMKRHVELRFDLLMAGVTQLLLVLDQHEVALGGTMGRMATDATQIILAVRRPRKVRMLFAGGVAVEAALIDFFGSRRFETENLLSVTRIFGMSAPRPVAGFTTMGFKALLCFQDIIPVPCGLKPFKDVFVTALAPIRPDIPRTRLRLGRRSLGSLAEARDARQGNKGGEYSQSRKSNPLTRSNHGLLPV
jgi:hypothetical protein